MATQVGRYEMIRELRRDGVGRLWLARDEERQIDVTVRVLDPLSGLDEEARRAAALAADETVRALAELGSSELAPVLERIEFDGCPALVVGLIEGQPFATFGRPESLLSIDDAVTLVARVADALGVAAAAGVVHGQVRPWNLLRVGRQGVRITDFGVAPALHAARVQDAVLEHGAGYLPPERLRGGPCTEQGDLFSLAAVLYELLGGEPAFAGHGASSVVYRLVHEPPGDPERMPRPIPAALRQPLARALAKLPDQRFASGGAFATALRTALVEVRDEERLPRAVAVERAEASRSRRSLPQVAVGARGVPRSARRWQWIAGVAALAVVAAAWAVRGKLGSRVEEVWYEARVRVEPAEAVVALDGIPLDEGHDRLVRFRAGAPLGTLTATLACRSVERRLEPTDAAGEIVLELPPTRLDWRFEPGVHGAQVAQNGRPAATAPVDLDLDLCRDNRIVVEAPGYVPVTLEIPAGAAVSEARARLEGVSLARIPMGKLVVPGLSGVKLVWYADGQRVGESGREIQLRAGRHVLRYKNEYHWIDGTLTVDVAAGRTVRPAMDGVTLASLSVQTFPAAANVYLRRRGQAWRPLDETPATRRVATGSYEVKVELAATGQTELREVTLRPGDNPPVRIAFGGS